MQNMYSSIVAKRLVDVMIVKEIINPKDKNIYLYGIQEGIILIENLIVTAVLGIFFGHIIETLIFLIAYIPLRSFSGGYHALNQKRCFVYSILLILFIQIYLAWFNTTFFIITFILYFIFLIYLCRYAPLPSQNKPLSSFEKKKYGKKVRLICGIESVLFLLSITVQYVKIANGIMLAIVITGLLFWIEKRHIITNKRLI